MYYIYYIPIATVLHNILILIAVVLKYMCVCYRGVLRQISCVYQVPIRLQSRESVKQLGAKLLSLLNTTSVMCLRKVGCV